MIRVNMFRSSVNTAFFLSTKAIQLISKLLTKITAMVSCQQQFKLKLTNRDWEGCAPCAFDT